MDLALFSVEYVKKAIQTFISTMQISLPYNEEGLTLELLHTDKEAWDEGMECYLYTRHAYDMFTPVLHLNKQTWMSITPLEIESHRLPIEFATGDVVVFGLGLGYFVQQILAKPTVKHVRVIENDPKIIHLFSHLFPPNDKLQIIQADAHQIHGLTADFAYCDIYSFVCDSYAIIQDFVQLTSQNNFHKYFAWSQEGILYGLIGDFLHFERIEPTYNSLLDAFRNDHPLSQVLRWLKQGMPYLQLLNEFKESKPSCLLSLDPPPISILRIMEIINRKNNSI